jgi:hypothetical protein
LLVSSLADCAYAATFVVVAAVSPEITVTDGALRDAKSASDRPVMLIRTNHGTELREPLKRLVVCTFNAVQIIGAPMRNRTQLEPLLAE